MGFEPTYVGFANRCLTTWLPHQSSDVRYREPQWRVNKNRIEHKLAREKLSRTHPSAR
jgi:hypothetical protein